LEDFTSKIAAETLLFMLVVGSRFPKLRLRRFDKAKIDLFRRRAKEFFSGSRPEFSALKGGDAIFNFFGPNFLYFRFRRVQTR